MKEIGGRNSYGQGFKHRSIVINSRGKALPSLRIIVPQFEIYSNPMIKISDIKKRRFDIIDRAVQKANQQIMSQENDSIFKVLDKL